MTGYQSKKAAALDEDGMYLVHHTKRKDDDDDTQVYKDHGDALTIAYQSGYYDGKKAALAGQEPVGKFAKFTDGIWREVTGGSSGVSLYTAPLAQPGQERNFCPRCGKRTADLTTIHTCTPPNA